MNNPSTSDYYDCVEKNTTCTTTTAVNPSTDIDENKMELDDADDNNNNNNNNNDNVNLINKSNYISCDNVTSPGSSVDILDLNSGPLNPNNVTSVVTDQSNTDTASIASNDNYEEIGPIIKPKHQQQQQQQQQQRYHLHHQNPEQRLQSRQQQHYSAQQQQQPSFSQQMYSTIPPTGYSLNHPYNHPHHPQHHNRSSSNQHNYQQQQHQQPHHSQYNIPQNYSDMNNPSMDSSTLLQQQQQQQNESSQQQYFKQEPIFRPPPTSAYYQNYYAPPQKPPNFDYAAMYGHHPQNIPHPTASQMFWYSQHNRHNHQRGFVPSTLPPGHPHHSTGHHPHPHHHLHPQHSQYLSPNATGSGVNPHFGGGHQQHEQMMNVLQFSNSNGREARNRAEKQRRDKLNGSIADLATMVPHVAESPRRVDKTAVLRYSAHGLRLRYVFGKILENSSSTPESGSGTGLLLTDSLTKLLDAFLLTMTCRGQIVLITPSVEQHLGHCQTDLFGQNILHITHPDDHAMLKKQLIPTDLEQLLDIQDDENGDPRPRTQEEEKEIDRKLLADKRNFTVRLARATPRSEPTSYELVKIDGCFRRADSAPRGVKASTFPTGIPMIRRARGRDDSVPLHSISANDIVLVAMARIIKPPKVIERLREANYMEYRTRHLIDGRMIMVDQRISLVAGYMTDEVTGLSPFTFMHQDDVRWVIVALRQMYDSNSSYGESCYRLLTRTGNFIYLRTRGYLEIDKSTNQVRSFLCINSLVSEEEGRQRCQDMKNKFSIIINAHVPSSNTDALAVDNPQQLEKAVIYLIENLQRTAREVVEVDNDDEYCNENKSSDRNTASSSRAILDSDGNNTTKVNSERITKSPPLTLIPPNATSIKHSISKSVTIVNTTAAKNFRNSRVKNKSISENSNLRDDTSSIDDDNNSSNSNNNSIFYDDNYTEVKQEDHKNENSSFSYNNINNSNCNNKDKNNGNNSNNNCNNNNNDKRENDSNILIKTENIEYISDNENANDNNNRVPPLPTSDDYYDMEILNTPNDNSTSYCGTNNFMMLSSTEFKMTSSSSASSYKCENELIRDIEQRHPDLKRIRNTYEDITSDSCDSPSKKRLALSNSPLGLENISTSSMDNDQIFVNTTQTLQKASNPQEELTQLLPSSFSQIKNSLSHIKTAATELKRQCIGYADSKNQLEQIIDERDKQEELLENIQNEYEAHLLQHHQGFTASPITGGSDGSISLPLPNVLTSTSNVKNSSSSTNVIDFETDDILQRNIDITNATR